MSDANAFDPSTWGDDDDNAPITEDHGLVSPPGPEIDRAALETEHADLLELHRSTSAQLMKAQATAEAAETELGRLEFRIAAVERELSEHAEFIAHADTEDEG